MPSQSLLPTKNFLGAQQTTPGAVFNQPPMAASSIKGRLNYPSDMDQKQSLNQIPYFFDYGYLKQI